MNMNAAHSAGSSFQYPPSRYTTDLFIKSLFNFSLGNLLGIWLDLWPIFIRFWNYLRLILVSITRIHGFPKSKLISYVWSVGCAAKRLFMGFCLHCIKYLILNTCQWDIFCFKHFSQMYQYYDMALLAEDYVSNMLLILATNLIHLSHLYLIICIGSIHCICSFIQVIIGNINPYLCFSFLVN